MSIRPDSPKTHGLYLLRQRLSDMAGLALRAVYGKPDQLVRVLLANTCDVPVRCLIVCNTWRENADPIDSRLRRLFQKMGGVVIHLALGIRPRDSLANESVAVDDHHDVLPWYLLSSRCRLPPRISSSCCLGNLSIRILKISRRQSTSGSSLPKMTFPAPAPE